MTIEMLTDARADELRRQPFTYADVGCTLGKPPPGFGQFTRTRTLDRRVDFSTAARAVRTWQLQMRSGLRVAASSAAVEPDAVALMRAGVGPIALRIPCRVVYVVDEPDRQGFAYGTLPGHPESGEEAFIVRRLPDGRVDLTVTAVSRPSSLLARLGGPITTAVQRWIILRYLRAVDR